MKPHHELSKQLNDPKMSKQSKQSKKSAFTLIEILIAVGIIALIVAIAIPALSNSKADSQQKSAEARAKVLNEARDRAIINDLALPNGTTLASITEWTNEFGDTNDSVAAIQFLLNNNLIKMNAEVGN